MSQEAMDAGVDVKVESDDEVEPYDGSYACGFCSESVRGTAALKCSQCSSNPVHWACVAGTKSAGQCATCDGKTMAAWRGADDGTAAASEIIELTRGAEGRVSASTFGISVPARIAEGGASASIIESGARARNAEGGASASTLG